MRAFIALEVPGSVVDALVAFQQELAGTGADLKLVERENLHLNLKFLGEISEQQVAEARSRLSSLSLLSATIQIMGAGAFPAADRPRVLWAGVSQEHEQVVAPIARAVIEALNGIGERDDRAFRAHITLARVRSFRDVRKLREILRDNSGRPFGMVKLTEIKFKSSTLTPHRPVYSDLGVYPLS